MNKQTRAKLFASYALRQIDIMEKKSEDYADEDVLRNFKVAGAVAGCSAELNCLNAIGTKVARLGILLKDGRKPNNESIEDSIIDMANYSFLLYCILKDKQKV